MQFKQKIGLIVGTAVAAVVVVSLVAAFHMRQQLVDGRRATLVAAVQSAANIALAYEQQAASGKLTQEEAQRAAKAAIKLARYGGDSGGGLTLRTRRRRAVRRAALGPVALRGAPRACHAVA